MRTRKEKEEEDEEEADFPRKDRERSAPVKLWEFRAHTFVGRSKWQRGEARKKENETRETRNPPEARFESSEFIATVLNNDGGKREEVVEVG